MADEDPRERQERKLEELDQDDDRDPETEYDREIRPGGDSTPQRPPQAD